MDWNEFARRVRRHGLLGALAEGSRPPRPGSPQGELGSPPGPAAPLGAPPPPPVVPPGPLTPSVDLEQTAEIPIEQIIGARLAGCTLSCSAIVTGLADLPAVERNGRVIEVALLRLQVRRPEGDAECCVRQHVPAEIRAVLEPGSGVMALAHQNDRSVAVVDWAATGEWIGAPLSFPTDVEQFDWPPRDQWPDPGDIEVYDVDGLGERLNERRASWVMASADLLSLTPLRSRVDQRDEWRIALQMRDGHTVQIKDRTPVLALARLQSGDETRVGAPIDVLISREGEVAVDWEATLRRPALKRGG
jgi:hypothetical protein